MRSISRVVDLSINMVSALLVDAGLACAAQHNETVIGVKAKRVHCDEIFKESVEPHSTRWPSTSPFTTSSGCIRASATAPPWKLA